jgi:hypothetical protein
MAKQPFDDLTKIADRIEQKYNLEWKDKEADTDVQDDLTGIAKRIENKYNASKQKTDPFTGITRPELTPDYGTSQDLFKLGQPPGDKPIQLKDTTAISESIKPPKTEGKDVFTEEEFDNQTRKMEGTLRLIKSLEDYQKGESVFGVPLPIQTVAERQKKIKDNPYLMTREEAEQFYSQNRHLLRDLTNTSRLMLKNIPAIGTIVNTLLYHVNPEGYQYAIADELRQNKSGIDQYADYAAEFSGSLAGLFSIGGGIHQGVNTIKAIETFAKTNKTIADAIAAFIAGTTYGGLSEAENLRLGLITPEGAIANSLASGVVWTAFTKVGTKDWLNLGKKITPTVLPEGQTLKGFVPKYKAVLNGQNVQVGYVKDKGFLTTRIANWFIDTGLVTATGTVSHKVAKAVDDSEKNDTPLVEELQKQFTELDLTQTGIEFALNAIFTGTIPRKYGKMPPPPIKGAKVEPRLLKPGEENIDATVRESMQPKPTGPQDVQRPTEVQPVPPPPVKPTVTPQEEIELTPEPAITEEPVQQRTIEDDAQALNILAQKMSRGETDFTPEELQLQQSYPNYIEGQLKQIKESPEYQEQQRVKRQQVKETTKSDNDTYAEITRRFKNAQRKGQLAGIESIREGVTTITTPEVRTKADELLKQVEQHNNKLREKNEFTLENLSKKIYGKTDLNTLTVEQQQGLLAEYNEMKKQGITEFRPLKGPDETPLIKGDKDAVQKRSPEKILQRQPEEIGEAGSERGGIQPIVKGQKITEAEEEGFLKKESDEETRILKPEDDLEVEPEPSEAQKEAGNYKKGHVERDGLDISLENLKGSTRSGTNKSGKKWEIELQNDYGYIKGTTGKDKDHLDVFLAEDYQEDSPVFIINQTTPDGKFDEHKVMLGFETMLQAEQAYNSNYEEGKAFHSDVIEMPMETFKVWSKEPLLTNKPAVDKTSIDNNKVAIQRMLKQGKSIKQIAKALNFSTDEVIKQGGLKDLAEYYEGDEAASILEDVKAGNVVTIDADAESKQEAMKRVNPTLYKLAQKSATVDDFIKAVAKSSKTSVENISAENLTEFYNRVEPIKKEVEAEVEPETNIATDAKGYPIVTDNYGYDHTIKLWGTHVVRTSPIKEEISESGIKTSNYTLGGSGWEWWGFKKQGDIWEGYVEGFENEFGTFLESELKENGIKIVTDPKELQELNPPIEWKWKQKKVTKPQKPQELPQELKAEKKPTKAPEPQVKPGKKSEKPSVIDDEMKNIIKDIEKGLEGITFQLKKPQQPEFKKDIGPKAVLGKKKPSFQLKPGEKIPSDVQTKANDLIGKFIDKEVYRFKDIVEATGNAFGEETLQRIFPALKAGYTAYLTNATDAETKEMDSFDIVKKFTLESPEGKEYDSLRKEVKQLLIDVNEMTPAQADYKLRGTNAATMAGWKKELTERAEAKGETGISRPFIQRVREEIRSGNQLNKTQLEKIANEFGITDPNVAKEQAELAIVAEARKIINESKNEKEAYDNIVELYNNQPNLTHRTNISVEKQQYSTPAPIAYIAGLFVADGVGNGDVLEPSAGNGMLVISFNTGQVYVNEIDSVRNTNLRQTGYEGIANIDAEKNDNIFGKKFDGIITNPPFGKSSGEKKFNDYKLNKLEHIMAANALKQMNADGRAAIIIGGHNSYDNKGRLQNDRIFFNWLNHYYNVEAVLNIEGDLYKKQGAQFPVRLILINGKKETPQGASPLYDAQKDAVIKDFEDLYNRVKEIRDETLLRPGDDVQRRPGGITDVRSPGGRKVQEPEGAETLPEVEVGRPDKEKPTKPSEVGEFGVRPSGTGKPVRGDTGTVGRPDSGKPTLPGSVPGGKAGQEGRRDIDTGRSGKDVQQGFDREPPSAIARAILEEGKPNLPYKAESKGVTLETVIPRNMAYETSKQLRNLAEDVGGDLDQFVADKLGYKDKEELYGYLGAEQIDATAMAIIAIEQGQGMIIGDMTGVGKGRIAASIIKYGVREGYKPVFFTEKADLFSDFYRDLVDTGSKDLIPFIVNNPSAKNSPNIVDEDGNLVHTALSGDKKSTILRIGDLGKYDFVLSTYSQVNSERSGLKRNFIEDLVRDNILVMDESHNASGDSNTGEFFRDLVRDAKGVTYLSATFAKRPDNMPVYAVKTAISEANLTEDGLVAAIEKGGVALQEILSTDMVEAGQMIRREKSYEGIKIDYKPLTEKKTEHTKIVDSVTEIIRDIIAFQKNHVNGIVDAMDNDAVMEGERIGVETGTNMAGIDNTPFASKVFNVVDQLLFSLKADSAADEAIATFKQGKKPVIAVKNTMESFLDYLGVQVGDIIENTDFSSVLERGLRGIFRIRRVDVTGESTPDELSINDLSEDGRKEYKRLLDKIKSTTVGITISPIDHIIYKLNKAGYKVGEITGRDITLKFRDDGKAIVEKRTEKDKKKTIRDFNNWENPGTPRGIDNYTEMALIVNASGSAGRSAHSSPKFKDQRQRKMVTVQVELNINTEIQKRGRINRTGQVNKPEYVTIASAIPAEQRLLMMAKKKLKSLDANVSSDQSQAGTTFEANDFLNKYGDRIVIEYLKENRELNDMLLDPLKMNIMNEEEIEKFTNKENAAHKVTGRVAILPTHLQEEFYKEIGFRYDDHIEYLNSIEENDLEVKIMPLEAMTTNSRMIVAGKGGVSPFGRDSMLETAEVNVLKKPFRIEKVNELLDKYLDGKGKDEKKKGIINDLRTFWKGWTEEHLNRKVQTIAKDLRIEKEDVVKYASRGLDGLPDLVIKYPHLLNKEVFVDTEFNKYRQLSERLEAQGNYVFNNILDRYDIGRAYKVPLVRDNVAPIYSNGIFLGWEISPKRRNPYAPSAIKMKFAVADSRQIAQFQGSNRDWLNDITSESSSLSAWQQKDMIEDWDNALSDHRREIKPIVTGNILQVMGGNDVKGGQLISYTTKDGGIKRGILIHDSKSIAGTDIRVPIKRARKYIQQLPLGDFIESSAGEIVIANTGNNYWEIEVPASKAKGGKFYLDEGMKGLVKDGRFDKVGNAMRAEFKRDNLDKLIDILQKDFGISVRLSQEQMRKISDDDNTFQLKPGKAYKDDFNNNIPPIFSKHHEYKLSHPYLKHTEVEFAQPKIAFWTREHIKSIGYTDAFVNTLPKLEKGDYGYEQGKEKFAVEIAGYSGYDPEGGGAIIIVSSTATPSAYTEEIIHTIQKRLKTENPELLQKIEQWESIVKKEGKEFGVEIPDGYETFAQAMVFTHLGYANENPDVAEVFEIPKDILDEFTAILNLGKISSDVLKGESQRGIIRLPSGKIDNSLQNFRQKRQGTALQLKPPEDKKLSRAKGLYSQLKSELGEKADVYPEWIKQMRKEYGKEFDKEARKVWKDMKEPAGLTEKEFQKKYYSRHIDIRGRGGEALENIEKIKREGFHSVYANALPMGVGEGKPGTETITDKQYSVRKGDVVYLIPKEYVLNIGTSKPEKIKAGWKPKDEDIVIAEYDKQPLYELYKKKFEQQSSHQLKPASKELINKVEAKGLMIDQNLVATYNIKGEPREFISVSTPGPGRKHTLSLEVSKLDDELKKFTGIKKSMLLSPNEILLNSKGRFPTPLAIAEAKEILKDKFDSEYQKFREENKPPKNFDLIFEEGLILENFARKVVAADKLGIKDINADLWSEATKIERPGKSAFQLRKPKKDRSEKLLGKKKETEIAREQNREPESGEGNVVDFGVGLGQVFTVTADKINDFIKNNRLEKELGIEGDPKLRKLYREFLTAPQWFFDKEPQLKRIWDIVDRHFVRNVNEETAILREDKWQNGKPWRKLSETEKTEFLSALKEYEQVQYELQRDGESLELLDWADYADEHALTPGVTELLFNVYKPVIETALDMVKDVDRYKIINETKVNPYLENYYIAKESGARQEFLDNTLEKAREEFFNDDPNAEALYENELLRMATGKADPVRALELAWGNNPNLRETLAEVLIGKKYEKIDGKVYFPSSRLENKYFLSAIKKSTPEEKLIEGIQDDKFFTTNNSLAKLNTIKEELEAQGYDTKVGKFAEAQQEILNNAITQEDLLDLALSAGIENDNPLLERLVKTIQAKGFSRHFIPKRFIPGFEYTTENFEKAIFRYMNSVPFYKNRTIGGKEFGKVMGLLKHTGVLKPGSANDKYLQDLRNKIENRDIKLSQALRAVASTYYLALSPAYLSQQIVQPLNTLLPYLPIVAKELGLRGAEAEKAFGESLATSLQYWAWKTYDKINRMTGRPTRGRFGLDPEFLSIIRSLERQGVGKPLRTLELAGHEVDPQKHYDANLLSKGVSGVAWLGKISGMPGILVEDFTRTIGIRALYLMGKKAGLRGAKMEDFISTNIAKTFGPASGRLAKPPGYYIAGEGRAKPMKEIAQSTIESWLTFKNFAFMNYGQWGKVWRALKNDNMFRPLAYKTGAQIGLGGVKYMMWTASILTLLSGIYAMLNITEDPEEQYEDLFKHFNKLVPGLGDALYKGISSITFKVDLSALFAQTAPLEEPFTKDAIELIGGAPASAIKDIVTGTPPRALRGFEMAERYEEEGVKLGSRKLIPSDEVSESDKTKRKLGFTPLDISDTYQKENTRQFKSSQYTDIIRKKVAEEIIPMINAGNGSQAKEEFKKLFADMKADNVLTEGQLKSIEGVNSFISQVVLTRLEGDERETIKTWKNKGVTPKTDSRNRERSTSRERTR